MRLAESFGVVNITPASTMSSFVCTYTSCSGNFPGLIFSGRVVHPCNSASTRKARTMIVAEVLSRSCTILRSLGLYTSVAPDLFHILLCNLGRRYCLRRQSFHETVLAGGVAVAVLLRSFAAISQSQPQHRGMFAEELLAV